jgi:hypothetical protein
MTDGKESKNSFAVVKSTNSTGLNMKETQFILHIIYPKRSNIPDFGISGLITSNCQKYKQAQEISC